MSGAGPIPSEIRRLGVHAVRFVWQDGHEAEYGNRYLRQNCPCAECRETPGRSLPIVGQEEDVYPVQISAVGRYAISMQWSDGHDSGIYSYRTLRSLCPCAACCSPGMAKTEQ